MLTINILDACVVVWSWLSSILFMWLGYKVKDNLYPGMLFGVAYAGIVWATSLSWVIIYSIHAIIAAYAYYKYNVN